MMVMVDVETLVSKADQQQLHLHLPSAMTSRPVFSMNMHQLDLGEAIAGL